MIYRVINTEGIGNINIKKLIEAGINTVDDLLQKAKNPVGRETLRETTGISGKSVLKWTNRADLIRINGVGPQFSGPLKATGADIVKELKHRVAKNLW